MIDINVDDIGEGIEVIIPDMLRDHRASQYLTLVAKEIFEEAVFLAGQFNLLTISLYFMADQVQC